MTTEPKPDIKALIERAEKLNGRAFKGTEDLLELSKIVPDLVAALREMEEELEAWKARPGEAHDLTLRYIKLLHVAEAERDRLDSENINLLTTVGQGTRARKSLELEIARLAAESERLDRVNSSMDMLTAAASTNKLCAEIAALKAERDYHHALSRDFERLVDERDALAARLKLAEKVIQSVEFVFKVCRVRDDWPARGSLTAEQERDAMEDFVNSTRDILGEALLAWRAAKGDQT